VLQHHDFSLPGWAAKALPCLDVSWASRAVSRPMSRMQEPRCLPSCGLAAGSVSRRPKNAAEWTASSDPPLKQRHAFCPVRARQGCLWPQGRAKPGTRACMNGINSAELAGDHRGHKARSAAEPGTRSQLCRPVDAGAEEDVARAVVAGHQEHVRVAAWVLDDEIVVSAKPGKGGWYAER
jgi:hypothetical protein